MIRGALVFGSVAAFLVAAEAVSRIVELVRPPAAAVRQFGEGHFAQHRWLKGDPLGWDLQPGPPHYNALGMNDYEYTEEKPAGTYRILVLGDSVAYGCGVQKHETFENQLEMLLERAHDGRRFEVLNMAVPGYNTKQELVKFERDGLRLAPDLVLVAYVMNDDVVTPVVIRDGNMVRFEYLTPEDPLDDGAGTAVDRAGSWIFFESAFARYLTYAFLRLRLAGEGQDESQIPFGSKSESFESLRAIRDAAARIGARVIVAVFPVFEWEGPRDGYQRLRMRLRAFLDGEKIPWIDLLNVYRAHRAVDLCVSTGDRWHPNRFGHSLAAAALRDHLEATAFLTKAAPSGTARTPVVPRVQELFAGMHPQLRAGEGEGPFSAATAMLGRENLHVLLSTNGEAVRAHSYLFWLDNHRDPLVTIHVEGGESRGALQIQHGGAVNVRLEGAVSLDGGVLVTIPRARLPAGYREAKRIWISGFRAVTFVEDADGSIRAVQHGEIPESVEAAPAPEIR
ncbi:MAG: hypothetical protein HY897_00840 [Deltaproteobacteria bacterium]|nr:hypothetical protein [Deltaproteobacteria bacterium]